MAQAEGREIFARAATVDFVVGPQSYHLLPELARRAEAGERAIATDFPAEDISLFLAVLTGFFISVFGLEIKVRRDGDNKFSMRCLSFLDLLHVTVEAGLSFDMSIYRTTSKLKGPLSDELLFTMNEMNKGRDRSEAFRDLVKRTQVEDLATFVTSIIQAEELGSNIGNVLRIQAETIRTAKRQRLETQAAKIPVKMTIPMTLCLLPAMLIVAVGPSIISIMENFLK